MANVKREFYLQIPSTATSQQHDDYWKLKAPDSGLTVVRLRALLEARGYATVKASDKEWLRDSLIRTDLGLMSYVPFSNNELRELLHARRIDASAVIYDDFIGTRTELIEFLDKADQQPEFHKFLDLPAEIRNRIYGMHMDNFDEPEVLPSQPPITFTNRQIRGETLAMFYSSLRLPIVLHHRARSTLTPSRHAPNSMILPNHVASFFQCTSPENIALIRRLRLHVNDERTQPYADQDRMFDAMMCLEVDLSSCQNDKILCRFVRGPWGADLQVPRLLRARGWLRTAMETLIAIMNEMDTNIGPHLEDVLTFRKAMEVPR